MSSSGESSIQFHLSIDDHPESSTGQGQQPPESTARRSASRNRPARSTTEIAQPSKPPTAGHKSRGSGRGRPPRPAAAAATVPETVPPPRGIDDLSPSNQEMVKMARPLLRNPIPTATNLLIVKKLLAQYRDWLPGARLILTSAESDNNRHQMAARRARRPDLAEAGTAAAAAASAVATAAEHELTMARKFVADIEGAIAVLENATVYGSHQRSHQFRIVTQYLNRVFPFRR